MTYELPYELSHLLTQHVAVRVEEIITEQIGDVDSVVEDMIETKISDYDIEERMIKVLKEALNGYHLHSLVQTAIDDTIREGIEEHVKEVLSTTKFKIVMEKQ